MQFNRFQTLADVFMLLGLVIIGGIVFGFIGLMISLPVFHINLENYQDILSGKTQGSIAFLKFFNLMATFGTWVVSAYALIRIRHFDARITWQTMAPKPASVWLMILPVFGALLFMSVFLLELNMSIPLPDVLKKFDSEANKAMLNKMLVMDTTGQFIGNILIIALAPAIFEEIFFRGTLQKLLIHLFGNAHAGIFITAFLFAGVHLNMQQMLPMLFIALVLGYTCYYTRSIWPGIILHFMNNAFAVIMNYLSRTSETARALVNDEYHPPVLITILSAAVIAGFIYLISKHYNQEQILTHE